MNPLCVDPAAVDVDSAIAHYREHGYARLGRVIDDACLQALRERVEDLMHGRVVVPGLFFQHDSPTGRYRDVPRGEGWVGPSPRYRKLEKLEKDALFRTFIENALFERVARRVVGDAVAIYRVAMFNKGAHGGTVLPWHQDGGVYWGLDREPVLQLWTALDDCGLDAGCLEVLPGTHAAGLATPLGGLVPAELVRAHGAEQRSVALPAVAGEVMLVHNHVWHGAGVNRTGVPRRTLSVCFLDAATRCLRRKRAPRQFLRVFAPSAS